MSVVPEDAGVYMCRAVNLAGEAVTSASIHVHGQLAARHGSASGRYVMELVVMPLGWL